MVLSSRTGEDPFPLTSSSGFIGKEEKEGKAHDMASTSERPILCKIFI